MRSPLQIRASIIETYNPLNTNPLIRVTACQLPASADGERHAKDREEKRHTPQSPPRIDACRRPGVFRPIEHGNRVAHPIAENQPTLGVRDGFPRGSHEL